jgi:hypothetical protein
MSMPGFKRKMIGLVVAVLILVGIGMGVVYRAELSARYVGYQLQGATDSDARIVLADDLVSRCPAAAAVVADLLKTGTPVVRLAIIDAVKQKTIKEPCYASAAEAVLISIPNLNDEAVEVALAITPTTILEPTLASRTKEAVTAALAGSSEAKAAACRVATRPGIDLAEAVVPLLADPDAAVRKAAVLAIGPVNSGTPVIGEEELFKLLSDPSASVRQVAAASLGMRGLEPQQIELGRKLAHPDARERMALLLELKFAGEVVKDPGPWLMRLSKDADPAVRAGAARVAFECRVSDIGWMDELAERDPDPLVRQIAEHYRKRSRDVRTVGFEP